VAGWKLTVASEGHASLSAEPVVAFVTLDHEHGDNTFLRNVV
jgi:hypothetical protein